MFAITIDVEPDLHTGAFRGVTEGLARLKRLLDTRQIKATLFVTCDCLERHPDIFRTWAREGHEIALHGYRHRRYDELLNKEAEIEQALESFRRHLGLPPLGFRAPQHSIDTKTLEVLRQTGFRYDSSYTPWNVLQLLFFPKKFSLWVRQFFSNNRPYRIRGRLWEIPPSALLMPLVSLPLRLFPPLLLKGFVRLMAWTHPVLVFYAHSWDFIEVPQSRLYRACPLERFIKRFDFFLLLLKKTGKSTTLRGCVPHDRLAQPSALSSAR